MEPEKDGLFDNVRGRFYEAPFVADLGIELVITSYSIHYTKLYEGFAAGTVAIAFGLAASSIFPALMLGIFYKRMNKEGVISGMTAGIAVTMLYVFQHKGIFFIPGTEFLGDLGPNWFLGVQPNAFGAIGAVVNFAVAFIVCKMTAEPPAHRNNFV